MSGAEAASLNDNERLVVRSNLAGRVSAFESCAPTAADAAEGLPGDGSLLLAVSFRLCTDLPGC